MPRKFSEERTRKEMIDPQLEQAGWFLVGNPQNLKIQFNKGRHLETAVTSTLLSASLYEPPLDMFGVDAVERWFTEKE